MRNNQQATTLGKQTNLINKKWKVFFAALTVMYAGNVLADDPIDMNHNENKLYKNLASDSDNEHETVSIDGKEVQIATDFVQSTCGDSNLKALQKDIEGLSFKTKNRGIFWNGYSYQCWSLALDLTDNEMNAIPKYIREEAQKEKGLSSDSEHWKTIAQIIKKRILIYDYQGKIGGFYEYGKEYSKNGTKRVYAESSDFGGGVWTCHYKELIAEVKRNDKIPEKQPQEQLFKATKNGNLSDISNAINNSADVKAINDNLIDTTSLCEASRSGNLEVIKSLIKNGANVNQANKEGITPLMMATQFGHKNIVKYLVEHGANINEQPFKEGYPLYIAKRMLELSHEFKQHSVIVDFLKSIGIKNLENLNNPEQYKEISEYLERKNTKQQLFKAIENGNLSVMSDAIKNGADVNEMNAEGFTPLTIAVKKGNLECVELLIKNGADINKQTRNEGSPLDIAEKMLELSHELKQHSVIVDILKSIGIKNLENLNNPKQYEKIVKYFANIQHKKSLKHLEIENAEKAPQQLFEAIENGNLPDMSNAIKNGADVNEMNAEGFTPLTIAIEKGNLECVRFLLKHGADVKARNGKGFTPLTIATEKGNLECVKFLLEHGADVNEMNAEGFPPLTIAIEKRNLECVKLLIKHGADIYGKSRMPDNANDLVFNLAKNADNKHVSNFLFSLGGFVSNFYTETDPLSVAKFLSMSKESPIYKEILSYLLSEGRKKGRNPLQH